MECYFQTYTLLVKNGHSVVYSPCILLNIYHIRQKKIRQWQKNYLF